MPDDGTGERESYAIELGALTQCPLWENHKRGRNWAAIIRRDPKSPGGLARTFWGKAQGEFFYLVPSTPPDRGTVLEFGADYYTGAGHKNSHRAYCVVLAISEESLDVAKFKESDEAFAFAKALATT